MKRKLCALLLSVSLLTGITAASASAATTPFTDLEEGAWYMAAVEYVYEKELMNGTNDGTTFEPHTITTRSMLMQVLYNIESSDGDLEVTGTSSFTDVVSGAWYEEAVIWAEQEGLAQGYEDGSTFGPGDPVTREQLAVFFCRYAEYKGYDVSSTADLSEYTDAEEVSDWAEDAMSWAVAEELIQGTSTTEKVLSPKEDATRSEIAQILMNYCRNILNYTEEDSSDEDSSTPPEIPEGELDGDMQQDGEQPDDAPEKPDSDSDSGFDPNSDSDSDFDPNSDSGSSGSGSSDEVDQGDAATEITEDGTYTNETYTSTGDDENALRITGATVTLDSITVDKAGGSSSNTENGDFYGVNAAVLATDGANVTITNSTITSSAQNGNGVFSYGEGTVVTISDTTITTTADNSGGIQTTGGGTTYAYNLTVETSGSSSAAIRSDRGGGTVVVDGGTYTSNGINSPAVYSTADITVSNAVLTANYSEALVIEGENSITLSDCDVYGNMSDTQGTSSSINVHTVMIYQSMSGDADVGTSSFSMTGGSLTSNNGDVIFVTNTSCTIYLSDVTIVNNETDGNLLTISGNDASNGWGSAGSNGAQVVMTADDQDLEGDITVDTISSLDLTLTNGSTLTGTINIVENTEGGTAVEDNAVVTIESGCTWNLTGDCTITSLTNNGTINYNGYTITLADGTVLNS